jgi:hypothetical protein
MPSKYTGAIPGAGLVARYLSFTHRLVVVSVLTSPFGVYCSLRFRQFGAIQRRGLSLETGFNAGGCKSNRGLRPRRLWVCRRRSCASSVLLSGCSNFAWVLLKAGLLPWTVFPGSAGLPRRS